jgi:hypothetical protein
MSYEKNFITKDYESYRQFMINLIPEYAPEWTDTTQSDFGIVLIELFANGLDVLSYYQDTAIRENIISTAERRDSIRLLAQMLGYDVDGRIPAQVEEEITIYDDLVDEEVEVMRGTQIATSDSNIIFETNENLVIPAGETTGTVSMTHGVTRRNDFIGTSDGSLGQRYKLTYPNTLEDTIEVSVQDLEGNRIEWEKVDTFIGESFDSRVYTVKREDDFHIIEFTRGQSGKVPEKDYKIFANYRQGGGEEGNVGAETLTKLIDNVDGVGSVINLQAPFIKGEEEEDKELVKTKAPRTWRTNNRAVTRQDFEDIALMSGAVIKAKAEETFNDNNDVNLYIVDEGRNNPLPAGVIEEVKDTVEPRMLVNNNLLVYPANYKTWNVDADLVVKSNYVQSEVESQVRDTLRDNFSMENYDFGEKVKLLDINAEIKKINGVDNFILTVLDSDVTAEDYEILVLDSINLTVIGGVE